MSNVPYMWSLHDAFWHALVDRHASLPESGRVTFEFDEFGVAYTCTIRIQGVPRVQLKRRHHLSPTTSAPACAAAFTDGYEDAVVFSKLRSLLAGVNQRAWLTRGPRF